MIFDILKIEKILDYQFNDKDLLKASFTHKSYINEHGGFDNERLEFLGDSILGFVVANYLFTKYKVKDNEGDLTKKKQGLVSTEPLAKAIKLSGLGEFLITGEGVDLSNGPTDSMYEDLFESLVASIYLDGGMKNAVKFIERFLISKSDKVMVAESKDFKSSLQVYTQASKLGQPVYNLVSKEGPDHKPTFIVEVLIQGKKLATGTGNSKAEASKKAAEIALNIIRQEGIK